MKDYEATWTEGSHHTMHTQGITIATTKKHQFPHVCIFDEKGEMQITTKATLKQKLEVELLARTVHQADGTIIKINGVLYSGS